MQKKISFAENSLCDTGFIYVIDSSFTALSLFFFSLKLVQFSTLNNKIDRFYVNLNFISLVSCGITFFFFSFQERSNLAKSLKLMTIGTEEFFQFQWLTIYGIFQIIGDCISIAKMRHLPVLYQSIHKVPIQVLTQGKQ